ncbi:MAG: zinc-ribbon domain-containing protein [Parasporobacterium sp.]|nr:zinc-ribbon domain-containing protein [Parasporobacterium sp.]
MKCNNCGNTIDDSAVFCAYCGEKVNAAAEQIPAPEPEIAEQTPAAESTPVYEQESAPAAESIPAPEPIPAPAADIPEVCEPVNKPEAFHQEVSEPAPTGKKGFGIAGLVLGICSVCFGWTVFLGLACGVVGLILSAIGLKYKPAGMAKAGLVLSIIGIAGFILLILLGVAGAIGIGALGLGLMV